MRREPRRAHGIKEIRSREWARLAVWHPFPHSSRSRPWPTRADRVAPSAAAKLLFDDRLDRRADPFADHGLDRARAAGSIPPLSGAAITPHGVLLRLPAPASQRAQVFRPTRDVDAFTFLPPPRHYRSPSTPKVRRLFNVMAGVPVPSGAGGVSSTEFATSRAGGVASATGLQ